MYGFNFRLAVLGLLLSETSLSSSWLGFVLQNPERRVS